MLGNFNVFTPLVVIFLLLSVASLIVVVWALVDAAIRPQAAFIAAGKQTKQIWLIILGVALLATVLFGNFLSILGLVAALVYLIDVRPQVRTGPRGGQRMGPYGPW